MSSVGGDSSDGGDGRDGYCRYVNIHILRCLFLYRKVKPGTMHPGLVLAGTSK